MDPDDCLGAMLTALREKDRTAAIEALEDMAVWLQSGGAFPEDVAVEFSRVEIAAIGLSVTLAAVTKLAGSNMPDEKKQMALPVLSDLGVRLLAVAHLDE